MSYIEILISVCVQCAKRREHPAWTKATDTRSHPEVWNLTFQLYYQTHESLKSLDLIEVYWWVIQGPWAEGQTGKSWLRLEQPLSVFGRIFVFLRCYYYIYGWISNSIIIIIFSWLLLPAINLLISSSSYELFFASITKLSC